MPMFGSSRRNAKDGDSNVPVFVYARAPRTLEDIDWEKYKYRSIGIWRSKNDTLLCVSQGTFRRFREKKRCILFSMHHHSGELSCAIYGETDTEIAETATYFWSLEHPEHARGSLRVDHGLRNYSHFDFAVFTAEQFTRILDANSNRRLELCVGSWTSEQALILATRPYCMNLRLGKVTSLGSVKDDGTDFLNALEKRLSSFGSLEIICQPNCLPFIGVRLERLVQLQWIFEKLTIGVLNKELVLLPFSAKVKALDYHIKAVHLQPEDIHSLDIVTRDLHLTINLVRTKAMLAHCKDMLNRMSGEGITIVPSISPNVGCPFNCIINGKRLRRGRQKSKVLKING